MFYMLVRGKVPIVLDLFLFLSRTIGQSLMSSPSIRPFSADTGKIQFFFNWEFSCKLSKVVKVIG